MRRMRDPDLLDRLQAMPMGNYETQVWRITREGRSPLLASSPKGRWDDGSFDVLYTALTADTARAELHFHLTRGQPVFPSGLKLHLHELLITARRTLVFESVEALTPFGVSPAEFGTLDHARLQVEYAVTQQIGEAAQFLGVDALIVPSARWPSSNLVILVGNLADHALRNVADHGHQDLRSWARAQGL
jgi:RES domain-containing protein